MSLQAGWHHCWAPEAQPLSAQQEAHGPIPLFVPL